MAISLESAGGISTSSIQVTQDWQVFSLPWSDFSAVSPSNATGGSGGQTTVGGAGGAAGNGAGTAGAGTGAPFDPMTLQLVRFEDTQPVGLWIDQVKLKACRLLDLNPPIPEPAALGSLGPAGSPVARYGQLEVQDSQLLDQSGIPLQLKGVSSTWLNQEARPYAESLGALRWMRDNWNLSVVRAALGIGEAGAYLTNYKPGLAQVMQMIDNAIELGVYVIVDWHAVGADLYLSEARAFFSQIAQKYGDRPNVIYEPFNEPTRMSWSNLLKPYHAAVVATIRSLDPDNLIVLGTPQWSQLVDQAATDPVGGSNLLYTLHFYSCTHAASFRETGDTALAQGIALFVTEFGATAADGGLDGLVCADEAARWFEWMAQNNISGTAWKLDTCADSSCILLGGAPTDGGFTDQWLHGHGQLVRDWIKQ
jgi:endoglucanase